MRYASLKLNDIANGDGIGVSIFTQGCPHRCYNCFNPETWDFNGGKEFTQETLSTILTGLTAHGIKRHLSILGGEPLCPENLFLTNLVITAAKNAYPDLKIYVWTGYLYEELLKLLSTNHLLRNILNTIDVLVDGPYIDSLRDITLHMRGSSNQRVINLKQEKKTE